MGELSSIQWFPFLLELLLKSTLALSFALIITAFLRSPWVMYPTCLLGGKKMPNYGESILECLPGYRFMLPATRAVTFCDQNCVNSTPRIPNSFGEHTVTIY